MGTVDGKSHPGGRGCGGASQSGELLDGRRAGEDMEVGYQVLLPLAIVAGTAPKCCEGGKNGNTPGTSCYGRYMIVSRDNPYFLPYLHSGLGFIC